MRSVMLPAMTRSVVTCATAGMSAQGGGVRRVRFVRQIAEFVPPSWGRQTMRSQTYDERQRRS